MTYDVACLICGRIDRSLYPELPEEAELFFRDPFSFPGFPNGGSMLTG